MVFESSAALEHVILIAVSLLAVRQGEVNALIWVEQ